MVPGDQDVAIGLVEADVRGRVARRLVDLPHAEVRLDLDAGEEVAIGKRDPVDPQVAAALRRLIAPQSLLGHAALARDLDAPLEHPVRVGRPFREVLVVGMHPELAPGLLDDRGRLSVMV